MSPADRVTLSLVSHTNVGKTTLARTLLRRDVGEVRDEAHVTEISEAHELIRAGSAHVRLYDTPGLGDTARLLRRLRTERSPLGWLLSQVWDRFANRPLWCTQQAIRATRDEADVILYLVNATETPEDAGYVRHELDLITWIDRPVLVLLNQTGPSRPGPEAARDASRRLEAEWREYVKPWPIVRDVLALDAFSRCWVQEGILFERLLLLVPPAKRAAMRACLGAWNARNREVFRSSIRRMAAYLAETAADREPLARSEDGSLADRVRLERRSRARAMQALRTRLEATTRTLVDGLIADHELDGRSAVELRQRLEDFSVVGAGWLTPGWGAALGGLVSGALGGLAADLLVGGLSFGGGAVAGAVLGALGGAGLTHGYRLAVGAEAPAVSWSPPFLRDLARRTVLRYLAVAHFGRGRGAYVDVALSEEWQALVDRAVAAVDPRLDAAWQTAGREITDPRSVAGEIERVLARATLGVLEAAYPEAAPLLSETSPGR